MALPPRQGLYDPQFEHDSCGLGFVATLDKKPRHEIVTQSLEILANLTHRGAAGCDPCTGDGAGILINIPHQLYVSECKKIGLELPDAHEYAVAMCFFAQHPARRRQQEAILEASVMHHGQHVIGWRDVPIDIAAIGPMARDSMPSIRQLFIGRNDAAIPLHTPGAIAREHRADEAFERILFMIRKRAGRLAAIELGSDEDFYVASISGRTVVYKGLMLAEQVAAFYPELSNPLSATTLALVHSRFSTNTFPSWERAHPFRRIAHNGEINTLNANRIWMKAREANLKSTMFGAALEDFLPIIRNGGSDSAALDNMVDFLVQSGRSLPHVMMMLIPEAFADDEDMNAEKRAFYEYHGGLIEPWDGPAAVGFTDGIMVGAMLDRNGLRPAKYVVTNDGLVVLASELGVLPIAAERVVRKGRVQPGKMFLVDTVEGRIVEDEEIKHRVSTQQPYRAWLDENKIELADLPDPPSSAKYVLDDVEVARLQQVFGYSDEDLRLVVGPMASAGEEPVGSMGVDIPLAVLSDRPQLFFNYFKQRFAQVTNPPVDPIREEIVMSMVTCLGGEGNLLDETAKQASMVQLPHPILSNKDVAKLRRPIGDLRARTLPMRFARPMHKHEAGALLEEALQRLQREATQAVDEGASVIILSDRDVGPDWVPIPSLLGLSAVHQHLIQNGRRMRTGVIVESAEPREVAHLALLVGFGAGAVNPYLALDTVSKMARERRLSRPLEEDVARSHYIKALKKGLLKTMSKMGISAVSSYHGAQIFEAIGVDQVVVDRFLGGTPSRIRGVGLQQIGEESIERHRRAYATDVVKDLDVGGRHHFRVTGEAHLWNPRTVASLQKAVRLRDQSAYDDYANAINDQSDRAVTLRGLWDLVPAEQPLPLDKIEPASEIVKRFATGAMSFGSISAEAHETLAIAMNSIGGRSNTGEGGEDPARFLVAADGTSRRSAIKQVASGRFGVTAHYLTNADELQIKMAQGAKPGEGGQLPGHKVDAIIARVRHSTPGVTLISPPPHHDIYSIEDLAQLIFDLKNINPRARISVKLVAEAGVGTIAAGVAKAHADVILISGHDGGTGASPLTSIHHAGAPWELGLSETQQVLLLNSLRSRVRLQVDGQLKTGRDVVMAALLGAEEFGFATAPLVAEGCIMMRKCHLNTCPVGVATQDPELRKRFPGAPEHVVHFMTYVAEEVRALMAALGFATVNEMVGRVDRIRPRRVMPKHARDKVKRLDFSEVLYRPRGTENAPAHQTEPQDHNLSLVKDHELIRLAEPALARGENVRMDIKLRNSDRATGSMLSGEIARRYGEAGLPDDTITVLAEGSAGQSFGAFAARGLTLSLQGDANDYVGKGLSGGVLAIRPPPRSAFLPEEQVIVGNTVLYGATTGRAFFNGRAGERFCVRASGVRAVVEGVGDHGCEYMTGGVVVVLGSTGRNFGAGMSGGMAYVLDEDERFAKRCNQELIELSPLAAAPDDEKQMVKLLVEEHVARTASPKARRLLASWEETLQRMVKVLPTEYRRIMADQRSPETAGRPGESPLRVVGGGRG